MRGNYSVYLFYLNILVVVFLFIGFMLRPKKKRDRKNNGSFSLNLVASGNASVFFDKSGNVTVISYVKDMYGMGRATGSPVFLKVPYSAEALGESVKAAMSKCEGGVPCSDAELMSNLGFKGWKDFSAGKRSISVRCCKNAGIMLNATIKAADGAYQMNYQVSGSILGNTCTGRELGEALKRLAEKCTA